MQRTIEIDTTPTLRIHLVGILNSHFNMAIIRLKRAKDKMFSYFTLQTDYIGGNKYFPFN